MTGKMMSAADTLDMLIEVSASICTERNLERVLHKVLICARQLADAEAGRVYTLDETGRYLRLAVSQNDYVEVLREQLEPISLYSDGRSNLEDICAHCAFAGNPIKIDDIRRVAGFTFDNYYTFDRTHRYHTKSLMVMPLRNHERQTVGVLELINKRDRETGEVRPFPDSLDAVLEAFGGQAAIAIGNAKLIDENRRLIAILDQSNRKLEQENRELRSKMKGARNFEHVIGASKAMQNVFDLLDKVLDTDTTVLILGETGTGKELIARAIHTNGRRRTREFIAQNCAALPEQLLESELFGYQKGAFSGADRDKKGLIELADGGTLFLDEIGDMPVLLQAKLLRVLQEREVRPLGAAKARKVNVRVLAATHCDLRARIDSGEFREDLYYRLCVFPIELPPLRARREDLQALLQHFLADYAKAHDKKVAGFSPGALDRLLAHSYPGNIRELRNTVERAVLLADPGGHVTESHLPTELQVTAKSAMPNGVDGESLKDVVGVFEAHVIAQKLAGLDWNQTRAAKALCISRRTLIDKMRKYDIHPVNAR